MKFQEWERVIDKSREELIIPNYLEFEDDKLVIKGYPNLKVLYANSCNLKHIYIDCPCLESLWLNDNKLTGIYLSKIPNLKSLTISNNKLKKLDAWFLENLEILWCFNNCLKELDCGYLTKLEDLNCSFNAFSSTTFEIDGKEWQTWETMKELKLDDCINLKKADVDMNDFDDLSFTEQLTSLEWISLRDNKIERYLDTSKDPNKAVSYTNGYPNPIEKVIFNSPHLKRVEIINSNIKEVINKSESKMEVIDNNFDEGYWSASEDAPTQYEQSAYEDQQRKEKADFEAGRHIFEGQECFGNHQLNVLRN